MFCWSWKYFEWNKNIIIGFGFRITVITRSAQFVNSYSASSNSWLITGFLNEKRLNIKPRNQNTKIEEARRHKEKVILLVFYRLIWRCLNDKKLLDGRSLFYQRRFLKPDMIYMYMDKPKSGHVEFLVRFTRDAFINLATRETSL